MNSICDQIVARAVVVLTGTLPNAIPVYRSREDALDRGDVPAAAVSPADEETQPFSDLLDESHFNLHVEIIVRGDPWDSLADPYRVAAHGLLLGDATLAGLCSGIRRIGAKWEAHEADKTAGILTQTYRVKYLSAINQL